MPLARHRRSPGDRTCETIVVRADVGQSTVAPNAGTKTPGRRLREESRPTCQVRFRCYSRSTSSQGNQSLPPPPMVAFLLSSSDRHQGRSQPLLRNVFQAVLHACVFCCVLASPSLAQSEPNSDSVTTARSPQVVASNGHVSSSSDSAPAGRTDDPESRAPRPTALLAVGAGLILLAFTQRRMRRTFTAS